MSPIDDELKSFLERLEKADRHRVLTPGRPEGAAIIVRQGKRLINFSSNDYLGLSNHPDLIDRARAWTETWGAGAAASRLVTGTLEIHEMIEQKIAALKGTEAALIFNSGYQANATILPALFDRDVLGQDALVFTDRLVHASIHHGCRAAAVREIRYRHNDTGHLETLLKKHQGRKGFRFIITESVFSMDGDCADLQALTDLAERYDAFIYLDEAHATGVMGPKGMGLSGEVPGKIDLVMGTFSKALGCFGAYVACSERLRDYLINRCGGLIYATALPPAVLGAIDAALDLVPTLDRERQTLRNHAAALRQSFQDHQIDTAHSASQIVPAVMGSETATLKASDVLLDAGLLGVAIRPPTVPKDTSRLRLAVTAAHTNDHMAKLLSVVPELASVKSAHP